MNFFALLADMFRRAAQHQPLTANERAVRKLIVHGLLFQVLTGLVAAAQGVLALFGTDQFQWQPVAITAAITFACTLLSAVQKWAAAQGDAPMADALGVLTSLAKQFASGGTAAMLAALNQTDRTNFVLKLMQGVMQLNAPASPAAPAPQIIVVPPGEPVPGSPLAQPVPPPLSQRTPIHA